MFQGLSKGFLLRRVIAVLVIIQFVAGSMPVSLLASDGNLRPLPTKKADRLNEVRKDLDVASLKVKHA
ncbi:MAG: hypothetical protein WCY10_06640, partial [Candidatus Omnitrophota bacterium]